MTLSPRQPPVLWSEREWPTNWCTNGTAFQSIAFQSGEGVVAVCVCVRACVRVFVNAFVILPSLHSVLHPLEQPTCPADLSFPNSGGSLLLVA